MSLKETLSAIKIPAYNRKQEIFNVISHFIGLPLAIFIAVFGICKFFNHEISFLNLIGILVFGASAFVVYLVSSIYHITKHTSNKKKILRVMDHSAIYLLIAGTYTPVCLAMFNTTILGPIMLIIEWSGAVIGISLNAFFFRYKVARIISFVFYIVMGWLCAFCCGWLYIKLIAFMFILLGGCVYSIGSILYAIGHHKNKSLHCVFHIFVLVGTIIQTIGVFLML